LAVVFILDGLANPALVLLRRDLQYKGIALQQAVAAVAGLAAGIALAFVTRSVWVLAVAYITVSLVRLTMSYLIRPYIPRLRFDLRLLRELSSYGRWVTGSNIALYLLNWGDNLVVSRFLGAQSLGLYQQAFLLSNLPATQITSVVGQVSFPYFAKLRAHNGVGPAYIRILHYVALVTVPTATLIFSVGPDAIRVVLGPKWVAMIVPLQILSIWGLIRSISTNSGPVFNAVGRPQIVMQQAALRLVVFGVLVVPMTNAMGIRGTALAVLLGALPVELLTYVRTLRACQSSIAAFSRALLVPVLGSSVMLVVVALVKEQFVRNLGIQRVLVEGALGVAAYLVTVALYYRITGDVPVSIREQLRFLGARWSSRGTADTQRACPRVGVPTEASETQQQA
jgi:O-antigen/teichoic acid export membrane protein